MQSSWIAVSPFCAAIAGDTSGPSIEAAIKSFRIRVPFAAECAELLKRLLDAGLSPFEPDPIAALAEAEQRTAAAR